MRFGLVSFVLPSFARIGTEVPNVPITTGINSRGLTFTRLYSEVKEAQEKYTPNTRSVEEIPIESTLQVSSLIYSFADLRSIVNKHEETFNGNLSSDGKKKKKSLVAFDTPALVVTRNSVAKPFPSTKMNNPVTAAAIKEFLERNKGFFKPGEVGGVEFVKDGSHEDEIDGGMVRKLEALGGVDGEIVEFDDKFAGIGLCTELVYAVVVNRSQKRITVVFRGSAEPKDFVVDADFKKITPSIIKEITDRDAKLHKGFADYLLEKTSFEGKSQLEQILDVLKEVYAYKGPKGDYSDYKLYVSGHSLGGSLAQLLAFMLAGLKEKDFIPKPVTAITFASPVVGESNFAEAYRDLEKENKLRHLRVSSEGDVVPGSPGFGFAYKQTGVNIHLKEGKKADVKYGNTKSILSQLKPSSIARHNLYGPGSYRSRMYGKDENGKQLNKDILSMTVDQFYNEHAP